MLNKIQLIGHLGRDPQVAMTPTGRAVARFTVAVNRPRAKVTTEGAKPTEETQWFTVEAWERLAETCERLLHTGDKVYVEGRINSRSYTNRSGQERTTWEVTASDVQLLESRRPRPEASPPDHREGHDASAADSSPF
jgi:single-strand DNA-binding protein